MFQVTARLEVQGKSYFFYTSHETTRNKCVSVVIGPTKPSSSFPDKKRLTSRIYTDSCLAFVASQNGHVVSWAATNHGKIGEN